MKITIELTELEFANLEDLSNSVKTVKDCYYSDIYDFELDDNDLEEILFYLNKIINASKESE